MPGLPSYRNRLQQAPEACARVPHGRSSESKGEGLFGSATDHQHNVLLGRLDAQPSKQNGARSFLRPAFFRSLVARPVRRRRERSVERKHAPFSYHRPKTLAEATALLTQYSEEARVLAGGQSLIPMMKLRLAVPEHLVDLAGIAELK